MTVELLPATKRLKQLISAHGTQWTVLQDRDVACFGERGLFIESGDGAHKRWVLPSQTK